jgi:hypothetical protein
MKGTRPRKALDLWKKGLCGEIKSEAGWAEPATLLVSSLAWKRVAEGKSGCAGRASSRVVKTTHNRKDSLLVTIGVEYRQ